MRSISDILSKEEIEVVRACLRAAADNDFFSSHEFQNTYQVTRRTMHAVLRNWPKRTVVWVDFKFAVCKSLDDFVPYPRDSEGKPVASPEVIRALLKRVTTFFDEYPFDWTPTAAITDVLSNEELEIVRLCLRAAVEGDFFPDWEFPIIFGVERELAQAVLDAWPTRTVEPEDFKSAVCNSLSWLVFYPHHMEDKLPVPPQTIIATLERMMPFFGERKLSQRRIPFMF